MYQKELHSSGCNKVNLGFAVFVSCLRGGIKDDLPLRHDSAGKYACIINVNGLPRWYNRVKGQSTEHNLVFRRDCTQGKEFCVIVSKPGTLESSTSVWLPLPPQRALESIRSPPLPTAASVRALPSFSRHHSDLPSGCSPSPCPLPPSILL